jgi:hypothetical protein
MLRKMLVVALVVATFIVGSGLVSADNQKPVSQVSSVSAAPKSPKDHDGELRADCSHPVDKESRKTTLSERLPAVVSMPDGSTKTVPVPETVETEVRINPALCSTAPRAQGEFTTASVSSASSWKWWTCSAKSETKDLVGLVLYRLTFKQRYQTSPYSNIVWPPSRGTASIYTNLGWTKDGDTVISRPQPYSYYSSGIVKRGYSYASQTFKLMLTWYTMYTRTVTINLVYGYNYCRGW